MGDRIAIPQDLLAVNDLRQPVVIPACRLVDHSRAR
jgi:hypothetical protein